jgi:hypothetical protein
MAVAVREKLLDLGQLPVFRTEIMAPFRYAVGFIDRYQPDPHISEGLKEMLLHAFFRGDEQETEVPVFQIGLNAGTIAVFKGTVVRCSRDAPCIKVVDLVLHQGDQRGDDQGQAAEKYCRELVT